MKRIGTKNYVDIYSQDDFTAEDLLWLSRLNPHFRESENFSLPAQSYEIDLQSDILEGVNFKFQCEDKKLIDNGITTLDESEEKKQRVYMYSLDESSQNEQQKNENVLQNEDQQEQFNEQLSPNHISDKDVEKQKQFLELKKKLIEKYPQKQKLLESSVYKISSSKRNIKRTIPKYGHKKIDQKADKLKKEFKSCIKIIADRLNDEKETEYCWKLGIVKIWLTIDQALKKNFDIYNRQLKKYKNTIKRYLPNYSISSVTNKRKSSKIKMNNSQLPKVKKQKNIFEQFEQNQHFLKSLRELFNDVITSKYINYQKLKSQRQLFNVSKDCGFQFCQEDSQQQSSHHTQYIPEINEFQSMLANIIQLSNQKIKKKYKCSKMEHTKTEKGMALEKSISECDKSIKIEKSTNKSKKRARIQVKQKSSKKLNYPIDSSIIGELQKFQQSYNYSKQIDNMLGHLNKNNQKLSCLTLLGKRRKNRIIDIQEIDQGKFYDQAAYKISLSATASKNGVNLSEKYQAID